VVASTVAGPPESGLPRTGGAPAAALGPRSRWLRAHPSAVAAVLALLIAAGAAAWYRFGSTERVTYTTVPLARGAVAPYVIASGTVNPVTTVQVGTYVSGVIRELYCDFNTQVKKDQLCAKIDPRPYQMVVDQDTAALGTTRAQLLKDQANLEFAQATFERNQELLANKYISQDVFDAAQNTLKQAHAQVALDEAAIRQREAELNAAKVNLGYTDIVSPVEGTVVSRNVTQGQTVAASFQTPTLFVIATDLTKMQVDTNVSESDIGFVHLGDEASFTVEAFPGRTFHGHVVQVRQAPQSVQNVVTYDAVSEAPNPELLLKPGMTAAVRIVTARHDDVLRVSAQALRYSPANAPRDGQGHEAGTRVWVLRGGAPVAVPVTVGLSDDANVEIAEGALKVGDAVILSEHTGQAGRPAPTPTITRAPRL
jgi:HlyD family secretion protein